MSAELSLWSDVECNSGTAERGIPTPIEAAMELELDQTHELKLVVPREVDWLSEIDVRKVIRVVTDFGNTYEWRVATIEDGVGNDGAVRIMCDPVDIELTDTGFIIDESSGGISYLNNGGVNLTVKNYIDTFVLPTLTDNGVSWITRGTVDANPRLDISWERWTPRQLIDRLADETGLEYQLRRNGATDYKIDLLSEIGSSLNTVLVSDQRNLIDFRRERVREGLFTVILPAGTKPPGSEERAGIGFSTWEVTQIDTDSPSMGQDTVHLQDRDGGDGPMIEDDQLNDLYLLLPDASLEQILDSTESTQTVVIGDATGLSVGDDVEVRKDSSGTLLYELESPTGTSNIGRIVGTYERQVRGERNYAPNPFATDWATKPQGIQGNVDGGFSSGSTSIDLKNLPTNHDISDGDPITFLEQGSPNHVDANATTDGSGNVTVTLSGGSPTLSDGDPVHIHNIVGAEPDDWTHQQVAGDPNNLFAYRDPDDTTDLSGNVDGAHSSPVHQIALKNLNSGDVIYPGDYLNVGANSAVILNDATVDGSGNATVTTNINMGALSDNDAATIKRPAAFSGRTFTNLLLLPCSNLAHETRIDGPSISVKHTTGFDTLWVSAGLTVAELTGVTIGSGESFTGPTLTLRDTSGGSDLTSVSWDGQAMAAESEATVTLRASYSISADQTVAARVEGVSGTEAGAAPSMSPGTYLRWVMIHLGADGKAPPVWGSYATPLWQDANRKLDDHRTWPTTYDITVRELTELWDADPAEEALQIGGTIRLKSPEQGTDVTVRVVGIVHDLINPGQSRVVLDTRRNLLTGAVNASRTKPLFAEVDVSVEDGEVKQSLLTSEDPPTKEGTNRSLGDPEQDDGEISPDVITGLDPLF